MKAMETPAASSDRGASTMGFLFSVKRPCSN